MIEKDNIQELLQEKLQSHEVTPPDAVWQNVSSSLSNVAATSGAAAGTSTLLKIAAAVVGVSGLGIATYFMIQDDIPTKEKTSSIQIEEEIESQETKTSEPENKVIEIEENENRSVIETPDFDQPESIVEEIAVEEESIALQENELELTENPTEVIPTNTEQVDVKEEVVENPSPSTQIEELVSVVSESSDEEIQETPEVENQEEIFSELEEEVTLPNIFTPNNDGANDFFEITIGEKQDFQIVVINHMNKVVFQSNSVDFRWDGMLPSGDPAPSGNYVYFISAKTMSGKDFVKSSKLRIQR
jgi:gliding motility-associated-like protein